MNNRFLSENLKNLTPYTPGEQPQNKKYVKLNTNENPYPPAPAVLDAIKNVSHADLRLYPDPNCTQLRDTISECYGVKPENVFVGNGSDEVLGFAFQTFYQGKKPIIFPDITYSFYPVYCGLYNIEYVTTPLKEDFTINLDDLLNENGGVIIPNPNAPTGRSLPLDEIRRIVEGNQNSLVIIDEAYIDFGGQSAIGLTNEYENLLVIHTLSKFRSLAGIRVGYAIGHKDLITCLETVKNSFNSYTINRLSLAGAIAAINAADYYNECAAKIIETREATVEKLEALGFTVLPSTANFIFVTHKKVNAEDIYLKLKDAGVLVRYFSKPAKINNYLRITIGTDEEMNIFHNKLKTIVQ